MNPNEIPTIPKEHAGEEKAKWLAKLNDMLDNIEVDIEKTRDNIAESELAQTKWLAVFRSKSQILSSMIFMLEKKGLIGKEIADELNKDTLNFLSNENDPDPDRETKHRLAEDFRSLGRKVISEVEKSSKD